MKKLLVCACLVAGVAIPATAIGGTTTSTRSFSGKITDPPANVPPDNVTFKAKVRTTKKPHHPKKVKVTSIQKGLTLDTLKIPCASPHGLALKIPLSFKIDVNDNKFVSTSRSSSTGNILKLTGTFTHQGKKVAGTVRAHGYDDGVHFGCDSGTQHWSAHT